MADIYNARKASTLPTIATVDPTDMIMVINDGAPPDVVLAPMDALAQLAGSYAPAGPTGATGPIGPEGQPGRDLAVAGSVPNHAGLAGVTGLYDGVTYVTADTGELWVYDSGPPASWTKIATAVGPKGDKGDPGTVGPAGPTGPQGVQGPQGIGIAGANVPVGTVLDYVGVTPPPGFLMCDGAEHNQTSYPELAALLVGSNWAQAGTVGKFRVPNLNGRTTVGVDPADATFGVVGKTTGDKNSIVVVHSHPAGGLNMQSHTHGVNIWSSYVNVDHRHGMQHTHPGTGFNSSEGAGFRGGRWNAGGWGAGADPGALGGWYTTPPTGPSDRPEGTTDGADRATLDHRHAINGSSDAGGGAVTGTSGQTGVDGANRNIQPSAVMSKIIRATV